jgi:hypothetical protein
LKEILMSDAGNTIRRQKGLAMGENNLGYGHLKGGDGGRNPGYAEGGHVAHKQHHIPTAGHHNMDGHIGHGAHHHSHKSHGHHKGVHMQGGGSYGGSNVHGTGSGGAPTGKHQSACKGPSDNQFGEHMPHGGTIGRW